MRRRRSASYKLLATFASSRASLFHALAAQDICHAVVAFVAGILLHLTANFRHWHTGSDFVFKRAGIVDCEFVIDGKFVDASETLS